MVKIIGRRVELGAAKETVRGTHSAATAWIKKASLDFEDKIATLADPSSIGLIADANDAEIVKQYGDGSLTVVPGVNFISLLLLATFGSVSSAITAVGSAAYKHTFSVPNTQTHQALSLTVKEPNATKGFPLAMVDSFTIKVENGKYVEITIAFRSKKSITVSATSSYSADYPLLARMASVLLATNVAGLSGATARNVRKYEITISKNPEEEYIIGSNEPNDILNQSFMVDGNMEVTYDNVADYETDAFAGTTKAMRLKIEDGNTDLSGNATNARPSLIFTLPKIKYTEIAKSQGNDEIVKQTVNFKGLYSTADSAMITAELINTLTSI